MSVKNQDVETLKKAFSQFTLCSDALTESYRVLKNEVRHLKMKLRESQREKEQLREEAERNHRLAVVGEMAAKMAHELRNPLGSIELFSSLLQKEVPGKAWNSEKQLWWKHLSSAIRSMDYTISNLLVYTGKPKPEYRAVDIENLFSDLCGFVAPHLQQNQIEIEIDTSSFSGPVWCDEDLLKQALINLITNAIEAMQKTGQLTLKAYTEVNPDQTACVIQIRDTGKGISRDALSKIFDPFFTTKKAGSGLGLAIAQNAIFAHQGTIRVESRPGRGSCFTLRLPQKREPS